MQDLVSKSKCQVSEIKAIIIFLKNWSKRVDIITLFIILTARTVSKSDVTRTCESSCQVALKVKATGPDGEMWCAQAAGGSLSS